MSIEVCLSIPAKLVIEILEDCIKLYSTTIVIRTDQEPEFRSFTFQKFMQKCGIRQEFIEKGSLWQKVNLESFSFKLREESLNRNLFENPFQSKDVVERHRIFYNNERPYSSLEGEMPSEVVSYNITDPKKDI